MRKQQTNVARILLVDDHPLMLEGLTARINRETDLRVCGSAANSVQTLAAVRGLQPDLVIVDVSLPGRDGLELVKDLRRQYRGVRVLVLSLHDESLYAARALRAGAQGYVMKSAPAEDLLQAIRDVLKGEIAVGRSVVNRLLRTVADPATRGGTTPLELLSDRELEVFRLLGAGHSGARIANELNLSVKTVQSHRANIRQKLGLKTSLEVLQNAMEHLRDEPGGSFPEKA